MVGGSNEEQMTSRWQSLNSDSGVRHAHIAAPAFRAASALPEHHVASSDLSIPPASYKGFRFLAVNTMTKGEDSGHG
jgi:hypothetical protein